MRFSSNHDENAWDAPDVKKFGVKGAKLAAVLVNTLPGIPLLYNGQEVGNNKKLKLFAKISIDWKDGIEFRKLYTSLFALRKNEPAFSEGEMIRIPTTNARRVYAFARVSGTNKFIVVLNFDLKAFNGSMDLRSPGVATGSHIRSYRCLHGGNGNSYHSFVDASSRKNPCDGVSYSPVAIKTSPRGFAMTTVQHHDRLVSLDAFRGATIAGMILVNNPGTWSAIYPQLEHSEWNGWTFTDWIFPFFLWIVGVALTMSFAHRQERGDTKKMILLQVLKRSLVIFGLGIFLAGFPYFNLSTIRIMGVLPRIAVCYFAASILVLYTQSVKAQVCWLAGLLVCTG